MIWTLLALLSLIVLGGFIAYYGDLQGRRWGKKRISKFGLRPKHTAILITSLTGAFIAFMSMATVLLVAPPVREVVLRGERAIAENKSLNADLIRKSIDFNASLSNTRTQLNLTTGKLNETSEQYARVSRESEAVQRRNLTLTRKNAESVAQNMALQTRKYQLERTVQAEQRKQRQLVQDNQQIARQNHTLSRENRNATLVNKDLAEQNIAYSRNNIDLEHRNTELARQNQTFETRNGELTEGNTRLRRESADLQAAKTALLRANEEQIRQAGILEAQVNSLTRKQDDLFSQLAGAGRTFTQTVSALRQGRLVLRAGVELARRTLDAHQRPEALRRDLIGLLEDADAEARSRGASRGDNGRAVRIVNKRVVTLADTQDADENASLNALIENLAGSDAPVVVIANTVSNTFAGEQALLELSPRVVKSVFSKGAVVASRRIDARQSTDSIVDALLSFLQKDVRDAALQGGLLPRIDPDSGTAQVGIIGPKELALLTERARRMGGLLTLTASASEPITSADPLRLTFRLTRTSDLR